MRKARDVLRVLACGGVDDGKSSLIGRLIYDAGLVPVDQLHQVRRESLNRTVGPEGLDLSLLVDGLQAEREQGITIDVAYRYVSTPRRSLIIADAPGHEQYTRNMVTGASTAQMALVLVDARKGVLQQTVRHSIVAGLLGVGSAVLLVNKMDLVDWSAETFRNIERAYREVAGHAGLQLVAAIPISSLNGDNVVRPSDFSTWFHGAPLLQTIEEVTPPSPDNSGPFRMPVQRVSRGTDFRGFSGTVTRGAVRVGDVLAVAGTTAASSVARIIGLDGDEIQATAGTAVTLQLRDEIAVSRGDVLAPIASPPPLTDVLQAHVVWLHEEPMIPGRSYLMRLGTAEVSASILNLKHRIDVNTFEKLAAKTLDVNEIGVVELATARPIAFEAYAESRALGGFVLIDRWSNATVGMGVIDFALNRATNVAWQEFRVTAQARALAKRQTPVIIWFTGLSAAGKSTIANEVERQLHASGRHTYILDGDNLRHGLNHDLSFTAADRVENVRRVAEVARLMADAGLIVLVCLISPFRADRHMAREIAGTVDFLEIFVDAPVDACERRDPKGLYAKARAGKIPDFTGVSAPYEPPVNPDLRLDADLEDVASCAATVMRLVGEREVRGAILDEPAPGDE